MTAHLTPCPACNEGLLRYDPQSGETRCGNCWARDTDTPAVKGGQGRDAETVMDEATGCALVLAGFAVFVAVLAWAVKS